MLRVPITYVKARSARRGSSTYGMNGQFFRVHLRVRALIDGGIMAPLYRLPIFMTSQALPKLIGDGMLDENEVYALIEWVNRIEESNRGLGRAGDAHAANDNAQARDEYSRNLARPVMRPR